MVMEKYILVKSSSVNGLTVEVNRKIESGYIPQGGPFFYHSPNPSWDSDGYVQGMVHESIFNKVGA